MSSLKEQFKMTPAMICTTSRFILGAIGVLLLSLGYRWWGFSILVIAFFTDFADGRLARMRNQVTDLGGMLDPIADKLLVSEILLYMIFTKTLPWIAIVIPIFELCLIILALYLKSKGKVVHSIWVGKAKFQTQWICLLFYFLTPELNTLGLERIYTKTIGLALLIIAILMTWLSLYSHVILAKEALKGT